MSRTQQILHLNRKIKVIERSITKLNDWIVKNHDNPEFAKVANDRSNLSVKLYTITLKRDNLKNNQPILGQEIPTVPVPKPKP